MAAKRNGRKDQSYTAPSRAELEAMKEQKLRLLPNGEAGRRERKLLEHYGAAKEDLQWIVDNNAWTQLGFDTFTAWYAARVRPAVAAAGLRPTQEFALYVLENVQSDEAAMPKQQRLLQRELADLVGVSVSTLRRLSQDPSQASNDAGVDLDDPADPDPADVAPAVTQMLTDAAANTVSVGTGITYRPPAPEALCPSPLDPFHCAVCGADIAWPDRSAGDIRCLACNPGRTHRAIPDGDDWLPECRYCTTRTSAVSVPAAGTDGTVTPEGEPADAEKAAALAGTPTGPTSPGPVGDLPDSPAAELIEPSHAGVPAVGDQDEERIEVMSADEFEAAVGRQLDALHLTREQLAAMAAEDDWVSLAAKKLWFAIKDSPAAPLDTLPVGAPPASEQPGQDSPPVADHPVATPGPAEIDHHQVSGVSPGGVPPEMPSVMAGELGDGGGTSLTPSSPGEPEDEEWISPFVVVRLMRKFADDLDVIIDHEVMGPAIDDAELAELHTLTDRIALHVGLIEKYRTP